MKIIRSFALGTALLTGLACTSEAQDVAQSKDAILILDASGSMWGQIDGVNKIVIAKDVVEVLVRGLPDTQRLGMVAYGHRKKGDCNDIQTLAEVGADREKIIEQIRLLSPVGMTPLSKSVEHAANELNYKKNAATVILVSDGLETCEADPCALARMLEENGLDFRVHVIGFDVTEEERKGLQCIADETGGKFLAADSADELNEALTQVVKAEGSEPSGGRGEAIPQTVALKATMLRNGPDIQSKLHWIVTDKSSGNIVFEKENAGYVDFEVAPGDYLAMAIWTGWPHQGERYKGEKSGMNEFRIDVAPTVVTVPIDLGIPVTLEADSEIAEGNPVNVRWSGPDELGASITVNRLDDGPRDQIYFNIAQRSRDDYQAEAGKLGRDKSALDTNGDGVFDQDDFAETKVGGPSIEGGYEVRYVLADPRLILARAPLEVKDSGYKVSAQNKIPAGSAFKVDWSGPMTPGDFITIEKAGSAKAFTPFGGRPGLEQDKPMELVAPAEPGDYEVRYVLTNGYTTYAGMNHAVQAMQPVTVTAVDADVSGPSEIAGGSMIAVALTPVPGNAWEDDYVSITEPGATKRNRDSWSVLSKSKDGGKTLEFQVPNIDGEYELVYFQYPGDRVLARKPLKVRRAQATVDAPERVKAGSDFKVAYSGPIYRGDRIIVAPANITDDKMWGWGGNYGFFVKDGEAEGTVRGGLKATKTPGEYIVRYVTGHQHQTLARDTLIVTE